MPTLAEIDLRCRIQSPNLFARLVWQVLFDYYRNNGGDLNEMDSLLCDLEILKNVFKADSSATEDFHLEFEFGVSGITNLKQKLPNPALIIERKGDKIFVTHGSGHGQMLIA